MKLRSNLLLVASALALSSAGLRAATYIPTFVGQGGIAPNTVADQWTAFDQTNYPAYPATTGGSQVWPSAIGPDVASGRGMFFQKQDLNSSEVTDFLSSANGGGIYNFGSMTHYQIDSTNPVDGLSALNFEISMAGSFIVSPTLTLHTTTGDLSGFTPSTSLLSSESTVIFGMPTSIDLNSYTWDLSSVTNDITGFTVAWQVAPHSISEGFQMTQGTAEAVPEPSTWALLGFAGTGVILLAKRRAAALRS